MNLLKLIEIINDAKKRGKRPLLAYLLPGTQLGHGIVVEKAGFVKYLLNLLHK